MKGTCVRPPPSPRVPPCDNSPGLFVRATVSLLWRALPSLSSLSCVALGETTGSRLFKTQKHKSVLVLVLKRRSLREGGRQVRANCRGFNHQKQNVVVWTCLAGKDSPRGQPSYATPLTRVALTQGALTRGALTEPRRPPSALLSARA